MRIVAGKAKGRKLLVPKGNDVRPTADRVREALFSSLGTKIIDTFVLDLFAGSGALGLESLSRGAKGAIFVEKSRNTAKIIRRNIIECNFVETSSLIETDAIKALKKLETDNMVFDVVFLDPPYKEQLLDKALLFLSNSKIVTEDTIIIAEHPIDSRDAIDALIGRLYLQICSTKRYGKTELSFFKKAKGK